jgi:hypothetical protein
MRELLRPDVLTVEIALLKASSELREAIERLPNVTATDAGVNLLVVTQTEAPVAEVLTLALRHGAVVESVTPHRESLEDLFLRDPKTAAATAATA